MLKLLIVDDERVPREGMVTLIPWDEYGIKVVDTATDGLDALKKIENEQPDIVLTDIKMPRMDGIELLKTLHEQKPDIDSLIISGYDEFDYAQKAINYGVKGYILKPVDPVELIRLVVQIVQQRKKQRREQIIAQRSEHVPSQCDLHLLYARANGRGRKPV